MEEQKVAAMENGHKHQEGQDHGRQEEDDLLYQEPCQDEEGTNISLCRIQATLALSGAQKLWNWANLISDPCSDASLCHQQVSLHFFGFFLCKMGSVAPTTQGCVEDPMRLCLCNSLKTSRYFVNVIFPPLFLSPWGADYILK